jgi:hypothetical protein
MTNEALSSEELLVCYSLRSAIEEWTTTRIGGAT